MFVSPSQRSGWNGESRPSESLLLIPLLPSLLYPLSPTHSPS